MAQQDQPIHWYSYAANILAFTIMIFGVLMMPYSVTAKEASSRPVINNSKGVTSEPSRTEFYQPYCGLYSVYAAARLSGKDLDFGWLIKSKYIGSSQGSTEAELDLAARDLGLHSLPVRHLMSTALKESPYPVVLHVRAAITDPAYDHWVLYTGCSKGKARILDPSNGITLVGFDLLSSRWDGSGLAISNNPISSEKLFTAQRRLIVVWAIAALLLILAIRRLCRIVARSRHIKINTLWRRVLVQALTVVAISSLIAVGFHEYANAGLLRQTSSVAAIERAHFPPWKKLSYHELKAGIDRYIIVDARYAADYRAGHIPGAINMPPDTAPAECQRALHGISYDADIVVYCQSQACPFSKIIANTISSQGYFNIDLYTEGWLGWEKSNAPTSIEPVSKN